MTSHHSPIATIIGWIMQVPNKNVIDVGVGFGKYGFLTREYTDIRHGRCDRDSWQTVIHGIEPFEPFASMKHLGYIYDYIFDTTVEEFLKRKIILNYDVAIMCDVLEHMEKDVALDVIEKFKDISRTIVITLPIGEYKQGSIYNNPWEIHKSTWEVDDIKEYSNRKDFEVTSAYLIQRM